MTMSARLWELHDYQLAFSHWVGAAVLEGEHKLEV